MVGFPVEDRRTTCEMDEHDRLAQLGKFDQEVVLCIGHLDIDARGALAAHLAGFAHSGHDDIGLAGDTKCFGTHLFGTTLVAHLATEHGSNRLGLRVVEDVGALGIEQFGACALEGVLESFSDGLIAIGYRSYSPCTRHIRTGVGQGADESYRTLLAKREQLVVVLEEHHTLAGYTAGFGAVLGRENDPARRVVSQ